MLLVVTNEVALVANEDLLKVSCVGLPSVGLVCVFITVGVNPT